MDAAIAAIVAAAIGGFTGLLSSTIPLFLSGRNLQRQLNADIRKATLSNILEKRQRSIETLWYTLTDHSSLGSLSDDDRRSFVTATLWVPARLRTSCLQALSSNGMQELDEARAQLIDEVNRLENPDAK